MLLQVRLDRDRQMHSLHDACMTPGWTAHRLLHGQLSFSDRSNWKDVAWSESRSVYVCFLEAARQSAPVALRLKLGVQRRRGK